MKRIRVKVTNMERQGEDIFVSANGVNYQIQDGAVVSVPEVVVDILEHCVTPDYKIEGEMGARGAVKVTEKKRFHVSRMADEITKPDAEQILEEVIASKQAVKVEERELASVKARSEGMNDLLADL